MWLCKFLFIFKFAWEVHGWHVICPYRVIIVSTEAWYILPRRLSKIEIACIVTLSEKDLIERRFQGPLNHMHIVKTLALEGIIQV